MQQKQEQMRTADTVMKTLAQLPKASYFKEKELFKDNSQAPITSRQIAEKAGPQAQPQQNFAKQPGEDRCVEE